MSCLLTLHDCVILLHLWQIPCKSQKYLYSYCFIEYFLIPQISKHLHTRKTDSFNFVRFLISFNFLNVLIPFPNKVYNRGQRLHIKEMKIGGKLFTVLKEYWLHLSHFWCVVLELKTHKTFNPKYLANWQIWLKSLRRWKQEIYIR